jgi:hypothetical protein
MIFFSGSAFTMFLQELRILNPLMRRELLYYVENNLYYFLTFGLIYLSFIGIAFTVDLLINRRKKNESNDSK